MENNLKRLRKDRKINQTELAKVIDVTPQAYSRYELGQRELGYDMLCKLADYYGVSVDYLIGHVSNPQFGSVYGRTVEELKEKLQQKIRYEKAHIKKLEEVLTEALSRKKKNPPLIQRRVFLFAG